MNLDQPVGGEGCKLNYFLYYTVYIHNGLIVSYSYFLLYSVAITLVYLFNFVTDIILIISQHHSYIIIQIFQINKQ